VRGRALMGLLRDFEFGITLSSSIYSIISPQIPPFPFVIGTFKSVTVLGSYCVGTRRPCILEQELIDRCRAILHVEGNTPSNHDQRMVAEIFLYYKLYRLLQRVGMERRGSLVMATEDNVELQAWRDEWDYLFRIYPPRHSHNKSPPTPCASHCYVSYRGF